MNENICQWILDHRWAILPDSLDMIANIVNRMELTSETISKAFHGSNFEKYLGKDGEPVNPSALEAVNYPLLKGTRRVSQAGRVAIVPIVGPIIPRNGFFTSGMSSLQSISYDFNAAMNSNEIDSIILNIDSPGGEITGIGDFAKMVFEAREKKKIISFVYGWGASAGYWIASAGSEIVIAETGEVGSIGVVSAYTSFKKAREKAGIKDIEIVSSQSPNKRLDPESRKGQAAIQSIVDELADVFIGAVAKFRGTTPDEVLENYGQGSMMVAQSAIENGLADRIGTLEGVIEELQNQSKPITSSIINIGGNMNEEELKAKHPELYNSVFEKGVEKGKADAKAENSEAIENARAEGADAENSRIKGIEEIEAPGCEDLISEKKFDKAETKDTISAAILAKQKADREAAGEKIGKEGKDLGEKLGGVSTTTGSDNEKAEESKALANAAAKAANARRGYSD